MPTIHEKLGERLPQRVVILRPLHLGELLCTVPAFRALRGALPEAHIALVALPGTETFVSRFSAYLDEWVEFPGYPGLSETSPQRHHIPNFLAEMQWLNVDLALQMHGDGEITNSLLSLFGAKSNAGFYQPGYFCPDEQRFLPYPLQAPEVWRHLRLMEFLGVPLRGSHLEFPLLEKDWEDFEPIWKAHALTSDEYICIHLGTRGENPPWPLENLVGLANLVSHLGYRVVLTGSTDEMERGAALYEQMDRSPVNLVGQNHLGVLGVLLLNAGLLICNDSWVSHLADALQTPSVVLFAEADPVRWAPLDRELHSVIPSAQNVAPHTVFEQVKNKLQREHEYVPEYPPQSILSHGY